jgi:hypothetical protein
VKVESLLDVIGEEGFILEMVTGVIRRGDTGRK